MTFAKIAAALVAIVAWFGIIGPFCVSAPHTELVVGWLLATLAALVGLAEWLRRKITTNETKKEST